MGLPELLDEIGRQGGYEDGSGPEPVVPLALFFGGNDDLGSIGCNLTNHPGIHVFRQVLDSVQARPEVGAVGVGISEMLGDDEWPFSNHVYVTTSAPPEVVAEWVAALQPDEVRPGWWNDEPPLVAFPVPPGQQVLTVWWD